jgi:Rrf2 family protein
MNSVWIMKMSEGVEWAVHCCLNLSWIDAGQAVTATKLAAFHDLPPAYLNKQLQALVRAGIVTSAPGPRGGFRLARGLAEITLMDVVAAIEGLQSIFRCTGIRHHGPAGVLIARNEKTTTGRRGPCAIAQAMRAAELDWRKHLASQTIADIRTAVERSSPTSGDDIRQWLTTQSG